MKKIFTLIFICSYFFAEADYWTQKASFPGAKRSGICSFNIESKGYICCGIDSTGIRLNDFWEYNPLTNIWAQKADFGGVPRNYPTGFSILNKGFVGLGANQFGALQDFWEYDPLTNNWTQKSNFSGGYRYSPAKFSIGSKGYISCGMDNNYSHFNDLWEYDPIIDIWIQKMSIPSVARVTPIGFNIGTKGYVGGGIIFIFPFTYLQDFWEYDVTTNLWVQKANTPYPRNDASGFSICDNGFFGLGEIAVPSGTFANDFWEYNPSSNQWIQKTNFPGIARDEAACFSIYNKGYLGIGGGYGTQLYNDFWEYTPDSICATGIEETPSNNLQFTISPNPAKEFIVCSLQFTVHEKINLSVTDINGRKILFKHLETGNSKPETKIDISNFSNGIYFVSVDDACLPDRQGKQKAVKKFLKE